MGQGFRDCVSLAVDLVSSTLLLVECSCSMTSLFFFETVRRALIQDPKPIKTNTLFRLYQFMNLWGSSFTDIVQDSPLDASSLSQLVTVRHFLLPFLVHILFQAIGNNLVNQSTYRAMRNVLFLEDRFQFPCMLSRANETQYNACAASNGNQN